MYIRANKDNHIDDRKYFDIPHAYVYRIKHYISNHLPEIISGADLDPSEFVDDPYSLQSLFVDRDELLDFLIDAVDNCFNSQDCNRLNAIIDYIDYMQPTEDDKYYGQMTSPYAICSVTPFGGPQFNDFPVNDPSTAIFQWFKYCEEYPTCVSICAKNNDYAKQLLTWVINNKDQVIDYYNKFNVPYKLEYLLDASDRKVNSNHVIDWPGDQVYPFCAG